jgi:hypothetical protein
MLAPIKQFYFYRIDRKSNRHKMVKGNCIVSLQKNPGLLEGLVLEVLKEQLQHNVTYHEANTCSQSTKCNTHV